VNAREVRPATGWGLGERSLILRGMAMAFDMRNHTIAPEAFDEAARLLTGRVRRTPLLTSRTAARVAESTLSGRLAGGTLYAKAEHLQSTGSFKVRGAILRLALLDAAEQAAGVIAISAGNHAIALAAAAKAAGVHAVGVMPETAVRSKVEACRGYGAEVILHGETTAQAWAEMERVRDARGLTFIHPFDHPVTIAGQGTVGLEILEDLPDVDVVVVGIGGGGLACGIATAIATRRPAARVWGVEPEGSTALSAALAADAIVPVIAASVADGLNAPFAGAWTLALGRRHLAGIVQLSDPEILTGVRFAAERMKQVLEPAGAAALAAVLHGRVPLRDRDRVCVILSGGNVATERLGELLEGAAPIPGL
jgi:threonine dehydratase